MSNSHGPATRLIHVGERPPAAASLTVPIYETSTFVFDSAADVEAYAAGTKPAYLYSRYDNPTVVAVETKIAEIDGAEAALVFGSGMAAISTAIFGLLEAGDEVVCCAAIYGGTFHALTGLASRFGVTTRFASLEEFRTPAALVGPKTKMVWFESPINPTLRVIDVRAVATACRDAGVLSVMDNTFASAINQPVLAMGVDLSVQSVTKYLNGHSDVTGGVLSGRAGLIGRLAKTRRLLGGILDPQPAYALGRGMKTLTLRVARHNETALAIAEALHGHPALAAVHYPGLPSHPDHAIAKAQMVGFGGMVCIDLKGGQAAAFRAFDRLQLFQRAASLGGVESLCSLPILTSQFGLSDEALAKAGVTRGMMRLSVGLEDAADLIADLRQAIEA
ncbi:MAG: PLP-dependent transferase [Acidobacteria bacterium]|nr:PLP-dependent transferase [Acidobacteriota bacterium]